MFELTVIGVVTVLVLVLLVTRQMGHRLIAPLGLTLAYWIVVLTIPIVTGAGFVAGAWGPLLILGNCLLFATGYLLSGRTARGGHGHEIVTPGWFGMLLPIGFAAGLGSGLQVVRANGLKVDLGSWSSIIGASKDVTVLRYGGELKTPVLASVLMAICFAACLIAPVMGKSAGRAHRAIYRALPLVGAATFTILTTARTPFLIAAGMTVASSVTAFALSHGKPAALDRRRLIGSTVLAVAVLVLFSAGYLIRYGAKGIQTLGERVSVYSSGSVPALSNWHGRDVADPLYGQRSFGGLFPSTANALYEFRPISPGSTTNVYTVFRALIEDFGTPGALTFVLVVGYIVGAAWQGVLRSGRPRLSAWIVIAFVSASMLSLLSSIFSFTNVCLGFALFGCLLALTRFEPRTNPEQDLPVSDLVDQEPNTVVPAALVHRN